MRIDANLVRNWGLTIGAAALGGSLAVATLAGDPAPPAPPVEQPVAGPMPVSPSPAAPAAPVLPVAPASAVQPSAAPVELSFLVHFQGSGPLGRAQTLAQQGRDADARRAAMAALSGQSTFRGLCFDRFTVGGAEMVLRVCEPVEASESERISEAWLQRLRALSAVAYCEPNYVAEPGAQ